MGLRREVCDRARLDRECSDSEGRTTTDVYLGQNRSREGSSTRSGEAGDTASTLYGNGRQTKSVKRMTFESCNAKEAQ